MSAVLDSVIADWTSSAVASKSIENVEATPKLGTSYEAGAHTRRTLGWHAPTSSPNMSLLHSLATLRDRSRAATRNNGYGKGVIDKLVTNIIGTGIKPLSQANDDAFRVAIHDLWLQWTDESDADGLLDYYGQQAQAVRGWKEGGEAFVRLRPRNNRDKMTVPLQLQILEPELCPHTHNSIARNGNRIRAGIEFNGIGRRVAYYFYPSRPTSGLDYDMSELVRVPASSVIHLYDPLRAGQLRGVPHLTQALIRLDGLDKYDDATLLRQQIQNLFTGFLKRSASISEGQAVHPLTNKPIETKDGEQVLTLEAGLFQELAPGEDVTFSNPPEVKSGYVDFVRQQLFHISAATGVPYETLTGDMSKVNDRTVRVILHEFRRAIQAWQHHVVAYQFCRPVWLAWLDRAWMSGAIELPVDFIDDPRPWNKAKWIPQGWPYLHPVQDVQATKEAVRNGFTSRSSAVSEHGEDAEVIDAEQKSDNDRADELGLKYDSDARNGSSSSSANVAANADAGENDDPPGDGETEPGDTEPAEVNA